MAAEPTPVDSTQAARTRLAGMLKRLTPSSMTQSQVELTAQMSTPLAWRSATRRAISGEDVSLNTLTEELGGGLPEGVDGEALVDLDHFAADGELGDFAAVVAVIAGVEPGIGCGRQEAGFHGPAHEAGAGVAGPEGAVAVKNGDGRCERVDAVVELCGGEDGGRGLRRNVLIQNRSPRGLRPLASSRAASAADAKLGGGRRGRPQIAGRHAVLVIRPV